MAVTKNGNAVTFAKAYSSTRGKAWRNMLVAAINAGIEQGVFSLTPGGEKFETGRDKDTDSGFIYSFTFPDGVPATAHARDAGSSEVRLHVVLWPSVEVEQWMRVSNAGFRAGEAVASGWLERERGAWLQVGSEIASRTNRIGTIASAVVEPNGFADRGKLMM